MCRASTRATPTPPRNSTGSMYWRWSTSPISPRAWAWRSVSLSRPPEASLQLALDLPSLRVCRAVVAALTPRLARVEVGTPLLLHEGIRAVEWLRGELGPAGTVVADAKICDAGARIARDAFAAGADVVTVVGAAADMTTWEGVLQAARASPGRPA